MRHIECMKQAFHDKDWPELVKLSQSAVDSKTSPDIGYFFLSIAHRMLGNFDSSYKAASDGMSISPDSQWGATVYYDACKSLGRRFDGMTFLQGFLRRNPDSQVIRKLLVDQSAEAGHFDIAISNFVGGPDENRVPPIADKAVVVQCFAKPDTVELAVARLLNCSGRENWNIIIYQDGIAGNAKSNQYLSSYNKTTAVLRDLAADLSDRFASFTLISGKENLGTTLGCRYCIDYAFKSNEYVVFLEDDCEFEPSALAWFDYARDFLGQYVWFIAGESIFFNPGDRDISSETKAKILEIATRQSISSKHTKIDFVPSSCFATSREIWSSSRLLRGLPRGDENLSAYLKQNDGQTLMPMVPLVYDRGMLHELGYSVVTLGKANVREIKNHFPLHVGFDEKLAGEFFGSLGLIHRATCLLEHDAIYELLE